MARASIRNRDRRRPLDPGFVVDGEWLCRQLEYRDPLWNDWHHNAQPMPRAAVEVLQQSASD